MKCSWVLLGVLAAIVLCVLIGVGYHYIETDHETHVAYKANKLLTDFIANKSCISLASMKSLKDVLDRAPIGGLRLGIDPDKPVEKDDVWDYDHTIFLAFQVIGSVGFGNAPPRTTGGRVFCVFYALVGIPLFLVAAVGVSELLGSLAELIRRGAARLLFRRPASQSRTTGHHLIGALILGAIGLVFFVLIPAAIFTAIEPWTYAEALYSVFMTTLTIGFADFVPGDRSTIGTHPVYQIAVGFWIIITLFWFSGIVVAVKNAVDYYTAIQEPLNVPGITTPGDQTQPRIRVKKNWRKEFDKQWDKLKSDAGFHRNKHAVTPGNGAIRTSSPYWQPNFSNISSSSNNWHQVSQMHGYPHPLQYPPVGRSGYYSTHPAYLASRAGGGSSGFGGAGFPGAFSGLPAADHVSRVTVNT